MTEASPAVSKARVARWYALDTNALERLPIPQRLVILIFALTGASYAFLSTYLKSQATGRWEDRDLREAIMVVLVCVFILGYMQLIKRTSMRALDQLRPVVPIEEEKYQRFARRMMHADGRVELILLVAAILLFIPLYVLRPDELRLLPRATFWHWLAILFLSGFAILANWILLSLIYAGFRSSLALRGLARSPLIVNVFDPQGLLPFGRLAVMHSLASVAIVLIPLLTLGMPQAGGGWVVLALSIFSLGVLFLPLWGVHRQIVAAREQVLATISAELLTVQTRLLSGAGADVLQVKSMQEQAEKLGNLRKYVLTGPSWPFRDYGTLVRIITAVFLPTLLTFMSLFIEKIIFPRVAPGP